MTDPFEVIERNTALAVERFGSLVDFEFGLDRRSVERLEGYIERMRVRPEFASGTREGLIGVIGSFLGSCVVAGSTGDWHDDPRHGLGVRFPDGAMCFPFVKVRKQFDHGIEEGESVLGFYRVAVDHVAAGELGRPAGD